LFLTNHALVLSFLAKNPRVTALEIAETIGIRERAARRIVADLEAAGYISRKREGRVNTYTVNPDLPLGPHTLPHLAVGHLLETLHWSESEHSQRPRREHAQANR
jgi:DNA-binding IclR family transcriptional regulator